MSFQVPRRRDFPRPLGDNSPFTPPDPPPPEPPPEVYRPPVPTLGKYVAARQRWIATGELEALWDLQDNAAAVPRGWSDEPAPLEAEVKAATVAQQPSSRDLKAYRFEALGAALAVAGVVMLAVDLMQGSAWWWLNLVTLAGAAVTAAAGQRVRNAR